MQETAEDLNALQRLLDQSIEQASPFLRASFQMPEHSLTARQLTTQFQDAVQISLATVTARGEPRVAPIDAFFYRGRFHVPTVASSARSRHLRQRPGVSVTYYEGIDLAIIAHGRATFIEPADPEFSAVEETQIAVHSESVLDWETPGGLYIRIEPNVMYSFARYPDRFSS